MKPAIEYVDEIDRYEQYSSNWIERLVVEARNEALNEVLELFGPNEDYLTTPEHNLLVGVREILEQNK